MGANVIPLRRQETDAALGDSIVMAALAAKHQIQEIRSLNILPEDGGVFRVNINTKLVGSPRFQWIRESVRTVDEAIQLATSTLNSHAHHNPDDQDFVCEWSEAVQNYVFLSDEPMSLFRPGR